MNVSRNRGGPLVLQQVCGLSGLQKEGRHREKQQWWESGPQLLLCQLCLSVVISCLASGFQECPEYMHLHSQCTQYHLKIASMPAGLTKIYMGEDCYMCTLRNKCLATMAFPRKAVCIISPLIRCKCRAIHCPHARI